jgi:hypothetical protein
MSPFSFFFDLTYQDSVALSRRLISQVMFKPNTRITLMGPLQLLLVFSGDQSRLQQGRRCLNAPLDIVWIAAEKQLRNSERSLSSSSNDS